MEITQLILQDFLKDIEKCDTRGFKVPHKKSEEEKQIGTIDDPLCQKLYILSMINSREAKKAVIDIQTGDDDPNTQMVAAKRMQISETLMEIFWFILREHYGWWEVGHIGIRQDWMVVTYEERNPIFRLMGQ